MSWHNGWFSIHNHSHFSNFRLRDATNSPQDILKVANNKGLKGIVLSDHETIAGAPVFLDAAKKMKEKGELPEDFVAAIGNEAYLIDRKYEEPMKNQEKVKYFHFLMVAKNQRGFEFLKKQTAKAWENSTYSRGMERVPTFKDELAELMKEYKGDVTASTACIGGELPQLVLKLEKAEQEADAMRIGVIKREIHYFIEFLVNTFGHDNVFFELQPSKQDEQLIVNKWLPKIAEEYNIKCIVTTDAHYLTLEQQEFHKQYLQASEGEREVESFYATTYIFSYDELLEYFDEELLNELCKNTLIIRDMVNNELKYKHETVIPRSHIPHFEQDESVMQKIDEAKYPNIYKMMRSSVIEDRYYHFKVMKGFVEKEQEFNEENLSRIDLEYSELQAISEQLNQPMTSYFLAMTEFVDIMWEYSLVGVGRGSAVCYYTNYLLDIVQLNPIKYDLPYWRFLSREYVGEFPDIDVDAQGSERANIIEGVKEKFGHENVLNIGTYTTEGPRAASLTACRAFGLDPDTAQNITNAIPSDKGFAWPLQDAFFGNEKEHRKPDKQFIYMVNEYPGLQELMLQSQGLVSGRGQHASGVVVFPDGYTSLNTMMKTSKGLPITQWDAHTTEVAGGIKYDFLSINALDRIRAAIDMLLKDGKIEWQGSLQETFNKYFHPDVLDMESQEMFDMLFNGEIISAFQFEAKTGRQALEKINARTFDQLVAANSLMRLSSDGEQPIDKYIRYKNDLNEWEKDMDEYNLTEDEKAVMHELLDKKFGVCEVQESIMKIAMHDKVAKYNLREAKGLRKASAKKDPTIQVKQKELFFKKGRENGTSDNLLNYIWNECYVPTFGYSFSEPHVAAYTMILMIEMNIAYRYGVHYWKAACLNVDAGIIGELEAGTKYGKVAKALSNFREDVIPPSVNKSDIGFTPDQNTGKIMYGLKPIVGMNSRLAKQIIDGRPYKNMQQFIDHNVINGDLTNTKMVTLIKSGLFDELYPNRKQLMINFVMYVEPFKQKLSTSVIPKIAHLIPEKYKEAKEAYFFLKEVKNKKVHDRYTEYFFNRFKEDCDKKVTKKYPESYSYNDNGNFIIEIKVLEKVVKDRMEELKEWLKTEDALKAEASLRRSAYWQKYCLGTISHWEMESITFYISQHELQEYPIHSFFELSNFNELPREPEIDGYNNGRGGKKWPKYKSHVIAGTVIDTLPQKGIATLITKDGVVDVRVGKGKYQYYNKKIMVGQGKDRVNIDDTWWKRGNMVVVVGYRRENDFYANAKNSAYQHSIMLIKGHDGEKIFLQQEKKKVEED